MVEIPGGQWTGSTLVFSHCSMTWNCHGESSNNDIIGKWRLGNAIILYKYFLCTFYPYPKLS